MMEICKLGKVTHQDGGIFYICKINGNHCYKYTRWCSLQETYVPSDDCNKCPIYIQKTLDDKVTEEKKKSKAKNK